MEIALKRQEKSVTLVLQDMDMAVVTFVKLKKDIHVLIKIALILHNASQFVEMVLKLQMKNEKMEI